MNVAYWCVLIAGVMPLATVLLVKAQRNYDNGDPRTWLEKQTDWRRRADFAHRNHFEVFPLFAAAVIIAQQLHAPQASVDMLALAFIIARVAYTGFYVVNLSTLRTVAFLAGYGCVLGLFWLAA